MAQIIRRICDLPMPVKAAKADWLVASHWIGFTPADNSTNARAQCMATIARQARDGYVLEYITNVFGNPNPGFETDETYLAEREAHKEYAGRLIAVHRLRPSARPAREILGAGEYERMQDMWAKDGYRCRWSVAFPIIESFHIAHRPLASEVFGAGAMKRLFAHQSAVLRPLKDVERALIADLPLERVETRNAWIGIADEIAMAEQSDINTSTQRLIDHDMAALEGATEEQRRSLRIRAAWLADRFIRQRSKAGSLKCDDCGFDPLRRISGTRIKARSLLDVHHLNPLEEGNRYTTLSDFALLCPTCHRYTHAVLRSRKANP